MQHFWIILLYFTWIGTDGQVLGKGSYSKGLEPRITHGYLAKLGQFPWQASIHNVLVNDPLHRVHMCGGSLINKQWILTAAHCLKGLKDHEIFLGSTHFFNEHNREDRCRREYLPSKLYLHPQYNSLTNENDIALIKLQTPVKFNKYIKPIKLANKRLPSGSQVVASGYGYTHEGHISRDLLFAHLTTQTCTSDSIWVPKTICTKGVHHENTCSGDSGGPLIFCDDDPYCTKRNDVYDDSYKSDELDKCDDFDDSDDSDVSDDSDDSDDSDVSDDSFDSDATGPFLVGISSYRHNASCEDNIYPQYFTDVYSFRDWISNTIEDDSSIKIFINGH